MRVISVPTKLRAATALLVLSIPLIAIEVAISSRSSVWQLPLRNIGYWALAFTLICIPLSIWLVTAKKWAYFILSILAIVWIGSTGWMAISMKYPTLGFFALILLGFWSFQLSWLKNELSRSFFDPRMAWYQGLPKPIANLKCQLISGEKSVNVQVSHMDNDGVFLFLPENGTKGSTALSPFIDRKKLQLILDFRDQQIVCDGTPILSIADGAGMGIQFLASSSDVKKEVGDFVEILRGQGYA